MKFRMGFSGGGTRSALLTYMTLTEIRADVNEHITSFSGVSGGVWGLTLYNNNVNISSLNSLGFDIFDLITSLLEIPTCCRTFCDLISNDVFMDFIQLPKTKCCQKIKDTWSNWFGYKGVSKFTCVQSALFSIMSKKYNFIPHYAKYMDDFKDWNHNGLLNDKTTRFLFRMTTSMEYPDLHPIMCSTSPSNMTEIRCAYENQLFESRVIESIEYATFMAIVGSAFTSQLSLSFLKMNPFKPYEISPVTYMGLRYRFLNDAGITYNNPYEHAMLERDGLILLIDYSMQNDFGREELSKIREYLPRIDPTIQSKIKVMSYCGPRVLCEPESSPLHWIYTPEQHWVIHISVFDPQNWNHVTDLFPTYNSRYNKLKIQETIRYFSNFVRKVGDIVDLISQSDVKDENLILKMTDILFDKKIINWASRPRYTKKCDEPNQYLKKIMFEEESDCVWQPISNPSESSFKSKSSEKYELDPDLPDLLEDSWLYHDQINKDEL